MIYSCPPVSLWFLVTCFPKQHVCLEMLLVALTKPQMPQMSFRTREEHQDHLANEKAKRRRTRKDLANEKEVAQGRGKDEEDGSPPCSPVLCSTPAGNVEVRPITFEYEYEMRPDGAAFKAPAAVPPPPVDLCLS